MKVEQQKITPATAKQMLEKNTINRPMNAAHVALLAREMKKGRWKLNGDTIVVNGKVLIDGQHRLQACVDSGVAFETLVVHGLSQDVFDTKDVGKRRSAGDTLATRGEKNTRSLAAALVFIDQYMTRTLHRRKTYTNMDVEDLLEKYPDVRKSVSFAVRHKTRGLIQQSVLCGCHYLFSQKDDELADLFCEGLLRGADLQEGEPVYILRERLMANALAKAKLKKTEVAALLIKAWNATRDGKRVWTLRWRTRGEKPEDFPLVK